MMRFPITDLLDEQECYDHLLRALHPDGLRCHKVMPCRRTKLHMIEDGHRCMITAAGCVATWSTG